MIAGPTSTRRKQTITFAITAILLWYLTAELRDDVLPKHRLVPPPPGHDKLMRDLRD